MRFFGAATRVFRVLAAALAASLLAATASAAEPLKTLELNDPTGDDKGPGSYVYPTDPVYTTGSFDLVKFTLADKGDTVEFRVTVRARIADPWNSKDWDGNGFSLQFAQIYIDTNHTAGKGHTKPLPGLGGAAFKADEAWDKLVLVSPQGKMRLSSEVRYKAKDLRADVVIPRSTKARGKTLIAIVKKSDIGQPTKDWGFQVILQSNEGYPDKTDILTRRVNETRGAHRFGGGNDGVCDPHIIDMLAGSAKGSADEARAQFADLAYTCGKKIATIPMIYAAKR